MCTTEPGNNSLDEPPCDVVNSAAWFAVFASAAVVIAAGIDRSLARHRWRYIALWLGIIVVSWVWASSW